MSQHVALLPLIAVLAGCSHPSASPATQLATTPKEFVLTNLHPHASGQLVYTANYQEDGLIPRCSEVVMGEKSSRELAFTMAAGGRHYLYRLVPDLTPEGLDRSIAKYFGGSCDSVAVKSMSKIDQQGIWAGKASVGMTKQAVIYAIGYPPASETPDTSSDRWLYFSKRNSTFVVVFVSGMAASIR